MQHSKKLKILFKLSTEKLTYFVFSFLAGILIGAWFYLLKSKPISLIIQAMLTCALIVILLKHGWSNVAVFLIAASISLLSFYILSTRNCDTNQIIGIVIEKHNNYFIVLDNNLRRYYVYEKGCNKALFEVLKLQGHTELYKTMFFEDKLAFSDVLNRRGVTHKFVPYSVTYKYQRIFSLDKLKDNYLNNYSKSTQNLINSLVFGKIDYSDELFQNCSEIKVLYFLRSSGLTYSIIKKQKNDLIEFIDFKRSVMNKISKILDLILVFLFWPIIGVRRIFLKDIFNEINKHYGYKYPSIMAISLSALTIIAFNIWNVYNIGFLIGLGISFYFSLSKRFVFNNNRIDTKKNIYLSMFLILFPFHCNRGCFPLLLPLYTLVIPYITIPFILLNYISIVTLPFVFTINKYADFIRRFMFFIHDVNINVPIGGSFNFPNIIIYYMGLILISYLFDSGIRFKRKYILAGLVSIMSIKSIPLKPSISSEITFLNIGQGDCTIIRDHNNVVMIDTGGNLFFDMATEVDIPYLRKNKIYHIDYLIASHADYDHVGAASSLSKNFPVYHFLYKDDDFPLTIGNLKFINLNNYGGKDENSRSLVLYLEFLGQRWLFTGDATKEIERNIIRDNPELRVDILKLGHHGSKTSSDENFLRTIQPKMGVISCGRMNTYGHPDKEVVERLEKLNIPYIRTDQLGSISYSTYFNKKIKDVKQYKTSMVPT